MKHHFTNDSLSISIQNNQTEIQLSVSSTFSGSLRKSKLYFNTGRFERDFATFWKSISSKKLQALTVGFSEIDYYSNEVDVYETPVYKIKRGLRTVQVSQNTHGSIPKEWSIDLSASFKPTSAIGPFMEVIEGAISGFLDEKTRKAVIKKLRPVLQGKEKYGNFIFDSAN